MAAQWLCVLPSEASDPPDMVLKGVIGSICCGAYVQFSRLRLRGFKSFGDEADLPIGEGLTGIVGPNGCGKSNVVEALRWVMGESSAKDLRGGEMDDVLFGGSALRPAFDIAEVALMVTNAASATPIAENSNVYGLAEARAQHWGGDLEISRRIDRGSGSTYRINNREVRARDVQLIFADAAAGSRSPSIISQGKVTTIIEAKPEDRRRLLEEAAGIGGLHSRRREAELKLNAAEANLARVGDRLNDLETDLAGLQRQAREAERYRKLSQEIQHFEQLLLLARVVEAETNLADAGTADEKALLGAQDANAFLEKVSGDLAGVMRELPDLQGQVVRLTAELAGGREKLSGLRSEAESRAKDVARIEAELSERRQEAGRLAQSLENKAVHLAKRREELTSAEARRDDAKALEPGLRENLDRFQVQETQARQILRQTENALVAKRSELAQASKETVDLEGRVRAIETELARAAEVDDEALVRVAERSLAEARLRFEDACAQHDLVKNELDALISGESERNGAIDRLRDDAAEAERCWQTLENERLRVQALLEAFAHEKEDLAGRLERSDSEIERISAEAGRIDLCGLENELAALDAECAATAAQIGTATAELDQARSHESETLEKAVRLRAARDAEALDLQSMRTEAQALGAVHEDEDPEPVLAALRVESGYERALSAALGDDLLSGKSSERPRYWQEIEAGMLPPWPKPVQTLDQFVTGEPYLALRLSMIGIAENAQQAAAMQHSLQPGQRLVTKEGALWRWDGFVQFSDATIAADKRVQQRRRQAGLAAQLPVLEARFGAREADLAEAETASTAAELVSQEAKRALTTLERKLEEAERRGERLRERHEDQKAQASRLQAELARLSAGREEIAAKLSELSRPHGTDPEKLQGDLSEAQAVKKALQQRLDGLVADAKAEAHRSAQMRARLAAIGNTVGNARDAVTQAESLFERRRGEAEGRRQSREQAVKELRNELSAVVERQAGARALQEACETAAKELGERCAALMVEHSGLEASLEQARQSLADNTAALGKWSERASAIDSECGRLAAEVEELIKARDLAAQKHAETTTDAQMLSQLERESCDASEAAEALEHLLSASAEELRALETRMARLEARRVELTSQKEQAAERAVQKRERLAAARADLARLETHLRQCFEAAERGVGRNPQQLLDNVQIRQALETQSSRQIEGQLEAQKAKRERMGAVNLRAAAEIEERQGHFDELRHEEADLREAHERLSSAINELDKEAKKRLVAAFEKVDGHFRRLFAQLFGGGKAHLRLTNIDIPGKAGLELDAMPPGKKLQNISLLSGGEKGLTALALVFALFLSQPSPLCVLDEVDAALDDANVERFVELMTDIARTTGTRFVVVTHHPLTMARMDRLFGVTMIERGVSRLVSVTLSTAIDMRTTA